MLAIKILIVAMASLAAAMPAPQTTGPYTGPCDDHNCGAGGEDCGRALFCVPFPSFEKELRQGCTCSLM
ncbi:hypothetical protein MAPG_06088 [Magnaporthiopsis poae ATCC 64411]|uniref:Uncharacterized protein n=1 Tax=Magnaporthiopsis poae (strain ATCC 64411 / 73-15) TaxID=644358 RepID=A0A0C4E143_MAGP6|nr:hypothetical protein MAPG_06088 [Magnaporthiopsis poae ATCC 64411]